MITSLPLGSLIDRRVGETYFLPHLSDFEEGSELEKEYIQIFKSEPDPIFANRPRHHYSFYRELSTPDFEACCPEFYRVRLPRSCPLGHRLPQNSVMPVYWWSYRNSYGSMVFAFDQDHSQLYLIARKNEYAKYPFDAQDGYVAIRDTLYYVGGSYSDHDVPKARQKAFRQLLDTREVPILTLADRDHLFRTACSIADAQDKKHLEVETYNFVTATWEDHANLTKLNSPKHFPIVFAFHNKIYALAGRKPHFDLGDSFKSFEYLDTTQTEQPSTWTVLPPPPFLILEDSRHILWKENKCLLVKVSDTPTESCQVLLWKFDLESEIWYNNTTDPSDSYYDPESSEFLKRLTDVPVDHFEGCIVNDMLFYFEDDKIKREVRLLVGYDLSAEEILGRRWEIDLKPVLGHTGQLTLSSSLFSHVADDTFCILVNYQPGPCWIVNLLCICLFDLKCGDDHTSLDKWKAHNLNDLSFSVVDPRCHYFQLPQHALLTGLSKLEGGSR